MGFSLGRVLLPVVEADPEAGGPKVPEGGTLRGASQCPPCMLMSQVMYLVLVCETGRESQ